MNRWQTGGGGSLTDLEFSELKTEYLHQLGVSTCTTCPHWKEDMFFHFRGYLKSLHIPIMAQTNKYMIRKETGSIRLPGEGLSLVNKGGFGNELTDEMAEAVLKKYPELSADIIENPDYEAPQKAATTAAHKATTTKAATAPAKAKATTSAKAPAPEKVVVDAEPIQAGPNAVAPATAALSAEASAD